MSKEGLTLKSSEPAFCRLECSWWSSYQRGMALAIVNIYLFIDEYFNLCFNHSDSVRQSGTLRKNVILLWDFVY
jgi:hypothetical protein